MVGDVSGQWVVTGAVRSQAERWKGKVGRSCSECCSAERDCAEGKAEKPGSRACPDQNS